MTKVTPTAVPRGTGCFLCGQLYPSRAGQLLVGAEVPLPSGNYRVERAVSSLMWGDLILLMPAHSPALASVYEAISFNIKSPRDVATGQAAGANSNLGVLITTRAIPNVSCLVMSNGLPALVAALANTTNVQVRIG